MIPETILLRASCVLLGLWGLLHAAQWLADLRHWRRGQALGWDLQGLRRGARGRSAVLARLYDADGLRVLALLLALVSLVLIALPIRPASTLAILLYLGLIQLLAQRGLADGADKIAVVAASGALLQALGLALSQPVLVLAGGLWAGGQLTIAYFAAGASKLLLRDWRSGAAPRAALTSYMWGSRWSAAATGIKGVAPVLGWTVMLCEVLFPLALLAPLPWLLAALTCFFVFHAAIALVMGLNTYPPAFLAAYPATIWLSQWLRAALDLA